MKRFKNSITNARNFLLNRGIKPNSSGKYKIYISDNRFFLIDEVLKEYCSEAKELKGNIINISIGFITGVVFAILTLIIMAS